MKNAPYLLPHIQELKPTSVVHYGSGQNRLLEVLRHAGVTRVARFDPTVSPVCDCPRGFYDLLLSVDVLEHTAEAELDALLNHMSGLARQAILVVDTVPAKDCLPDGQNVHATVRPHAWWEAKVRQHFAFIEPIRVRARRKAAFKTWPTAPSSRPRMWWTFMSEERRYRLAKLGFGGN